MAMQGHSMRTVIGWLPVSLCHDMIVCDNCLVKASTACESSVTAVFESCSCPYSKFNVHPLVFVQHLFIMLFPVSSQVHVC